jgi:hypothetical protein
VELSNKSHLEVRVTVEIGTFLEGSMHKARGSPVVLRGGYTQRSCQIVRLKASKGHYWYRFTNILVPIFHLNTANYLLEIGDSAYICNWPHMCVVRGADNFLCRCLSCLSDSQLLQTKFWTKV